MREPSAKFGWVEYPVPPFPNGNFREDLTIITQLVGSACYEWQGYAGKFYIRRIA
jgi:hypothetical protein